MSALPHPSNHVAMSYARASRLERAAHREGRFCSFCGASWLARIGRNGLVESHGQCPRCGTEGEP